MTKVVKIVMFFVGIGCLANCGIHQAMIGDGDVVNTLLEGKAYKVVGQRRAEVTMNSVFGIGQESLNAMTLQAKQKLRKENMLKDGIHFLNKTNVETKVTYFFPVFRETTVTVSAEIVELTNKAGGNVVVK